MNRNPFLIDDGDEEAELGLVRMLREAGRLPEYASTADETVLTHALREWRICRRLGAPDHNARVVAVCQTARALGLARATVRALLDAALQERAGI